MQGRDKKNKFSAGSRESQGSKASRSARPDGTASLVAPNKAAPGNTGRAIGRQRDVSVTPGGCIPVLAHLTSFGRNRRGSMEFLAYPVRKAC